MRTLTPQGFAVVCDNLDTAISVVDTIAPEHLEVQLEDADAVWRRVSNYGGMFIGENTAEVCSSIVYSAERERERGG